LQIILNKNPYGVQLLTGIFFHLMSWTHY